jgi:hypothetical protein
MSQMSFAPVGGLAQALPGYQSNWPICLTWALIGSYAPFICLSRGMKYFPMF